MKSARLLILFLVFLCGSTTLLADQLFWTATKVGNDSYMISFWAEVAGANEIYIKGPLMADYEIVDIDDGGSEIGWRMVGLTLAGINAQSQGQWYVKVTFDGQPENISSFNIIGGIADVEFPPVPTITYPADGDLNVIAEDCTFAWDSNGAENSSQYLRVDTAGTGFAYSAKSNFGTIDLTDTTWRPGWLEQGEAFMKIGYSNVMWDRRTPIVNESGMVINWLSSLPIPLWMSGDHVEFEVTRTIDLNDDNIINFADLAVMMAHWLETPWDF